MAGFLLDYHPLIIIVLLCLAVVISFSNVRTIRKFEDCEGKEEEPFVSILVPARNEAHNIQACVQSLLNQDYSNYEVIVLDDHSSDGTGTILHNLACTNPRLKVLNGLALPEGWMGKQWACQQLVEASKGELLLLTDADTVHEPGMLKGSIAALYAEKADLVTAFPRQLAVNFGEKMIIPVIGWLIHSFMPIYLAHRLSIPAFTVTIGQFMLFRRQVLEAIGGYAAVRDQICEDVALGRKLIAQGYRWRLTDATSFVSCRMYQSGWQAIEGFSKNVFAFFDFHFVAYLLTWSMVGFVFLEPPLAILAWCIGVPMDFFPIKQAITAVLLSLLLWWIAYHQFKLPGKYIFFYPLSITIFIWITLRSMYKTINGTNSWKGRPLMNARIRWL